MKIKKGVSLHKCKVFEYIGVDLYLMDDTLRKQSENKEELTITSGTEGAHGHNSRHYIGMALDLRTRDLSKRSIEYVLKAINNIEGVVAIQESTHIHLQINSTEHF